MSKGETPRARRTKSRRAAGKPAPAELRARASAGLLTQRDLAALRRWRESDDCPQWLREK